MLGKILKYEFLAIGKIMLPVYIGTLLSSGVTNIFIAVLYDNPGRMLDMFYQMFLSLSTLAILASVICTIVLLAHRYSRAILSKEAYFTFTMPVKNRNHILARVINAAIYVFITTLAVILSAMFLNDIQFTVLTFQQGGGEAVSFLFFMIALLFVLGQGAVMAIYAGMSLGTVFTKNRIGGMILSLFIFSVISDAILVIIFYQFAEVILDIIVDNNFNYLVWKIFACVAAYVTVASAVFYFIMWELTCRKLKVGDN